MPVDILFCEGGPNSPDIRVLKKLLAGRCGEIRSLGGKYGMGERILAHREARPASRVAGLIDGDFLEQWTEAGAVPSKWTNNEHSFGWRWSRKEIENYLLDPVVVSNALGAAANWSYADILETATNRIAIYQAARTALSNCRRRFNQLPAGWGRPRGKDRHQFPDEFSEAACREEIPRVVAEHASEQAATAEEVMDRWVQLLPEFSPGGARRRDALSTFAGKDLFLATEDDVVRNGFQSARAFREKILLGIESTGEDIADWLPEWQALRGEIEAY